MSGAQLQPGGRVAHLIRVIKTCFAGGDRDHRDQAIDAWQGVARCEKWLSRMTVELALFGTGPFPSTLAVVAEGRAGDGWEYDEALRYFTGRSRSQATYDSLRKEYCKDWTAAHHLLSDEAFAFFLPALLL